MSKEPVQRHWIWARARWWLAPWRLGVVLVYGALMTFVTAWGAVLLTPAPSLVTWSSGAAATRFEVVSRSMGFGAMRHMARRGQGTALPAWCPEAAVVPGAPELVSPKLDTERWIGGMTTVDEVRTYVYGLPFPAMRWWSDFPPTTGMARGLVWSPDQPIDRHGGLQIAPGTVRSDAKMLPLDVCWRPFAMNVVFWMLTMVVGVEASAAFRRRRARRAEQRRGVCPHCGYDRAGLAAGAVCPECGKK